jgi:ATP-binding cassette subfamily F protein uup
MKVLEYIQEQAEVITLADGRTVSASKLLELFGFEGKIQYSPVSALSGGERKRLYLVRLLMGNPNFLVLDEPTNDFDIYTMGVLEDFLEAFGGCLLVVSHDRCFMDKTADTLFILEDDGTVSGFVGTCSEYIAYREAKAETERAEARPATAKAEPARNETPSPGKGTEQRAKKLTFKEQKEFEGIEERIDALESRKKELENLLSGGERDHEKLRALAQELAETEKSLEETVNRWEYLASLA